MEAERQVGGSQSRKGQSRPQRASYTKLQAGSQLLTKSLWDPGWLTSAWRVAARDQLPRRHMVHLRQHSHCTPRKPSSWGRRGDKMHCTWAVWARQAPGHISCSDQGRHKTQAQPSLRVCGAPENLNLGGLDQVHATRAHFRQLSCRTTWILSSVDGESAQKTLFF